MKKITLTKISALSLALCAAAASQAQDVKFSGFLQSWFVSDSSAVNDASENIALNFRLRRAELKASGSVAPNTKFVVMVDPAKSLNIGGDGTLSKDNDNKILQDSAVTFTFGENRELSFGQFKTPSTPEGLQSSSELLLPERSLVARTFGDSRRLGIMSNVKLWDFTIKVMVANASAANTSDTSTKKDFFDRLDWAATENLIFGFFSHFVGYSSEIRLGANAAFSAGATSLRADWIGSSDTGVQGINVDGGYSFNEFWQGALRAEWLKSASAMESTVYTFGVNYNIHPGRVRAQFAYGLLKNATTSASGTYAAASTSGLNEHLFTAGLGMSL